MFEGEATLHHTINQKIGDEQCLQLRLCRLLSPVPYCSHYSECRSFGSSGHRSRWTATIDGWRNFRERRESMGSHRASETLCARSATSRARRFGETGQQLPVFPTLKHSLTQPLFVRYHALRAVLENMYFVFALYSQQSVDSI